MNTGIVDAIVLGRLLADVATGAREEAAIDLYQALRHPAAAQVIGIADRLTTMATMQSPLKRLLRNVLLRVVGSLPFLKRRIAMSLSGLGRAAMAEVPPIPALAAPVPDGSAHRAALAIQDQAARSRVRKSPRLSGFLPVKRSTLSLTTASSPAAMPASNEPSTSAR
jgi:hypothetical protein